MNKSNKIHYELDFSTSIAFVKSTATYFMDPLKAREPFIKANSEVLIASNGDFCWGDLSLISGFPGILLLFTELERLFPKEDWDKVCFDYVVKIKESIESKPISNISLFDGLTGCCFAIEKASLDGVRYQKMLKPLREFIAKHLESTYLIPFNNFLKRGLPIRMDIYDLLHGVVGIGFYFLKNLDIHRFDYLVREIINILINFTFTLRFNNCDVPGWLLDQAVAKRYGREEYPSQYYFDLSMSHGVSGVLAFLSIAFEKGVIINRMEEGIARIAEWIKQKRKVIRGLSYWDKGVSFIEETTDVYTPLIFCNDGWDYGTPGVARSLYLAGVATKNEELKKFATDAFFSIFDSNRQLGLPHESAFSQGTAGLLMLTNLMARDMNSDFLREKSAGLKELLLEKCMKDVFIGFTDSITALNDINSKKINQMGILNGVPGILLTLLSLEDDFFDWHSPFLIDFLGERS